MKGIALCATLEWQEWRGDGSPLPNFLTIFYSTNKIILSEFFNNNYNSDKLIQIHNQSLFAEGFFGFHQDENNQTKRRS